jgi:hypothetical protein
MGRRPASPVSLCRVVLLVEYLPTLKRHKDLSKPLQLLIKRHTDTSQQTRIFSKAAVKISHSEFRVLSYWPEKIVSFTPHMYSFMESCNTLRKISVYLLYWFKKRNCGQV